MSLVSLYACSSSNNDGKSDAATNLPGLKIKLLVGSALGDFCNQAAKNYNATQPKLDDGSDFHVECEAAGSGDVVDKIVSAATQFKNNSSGANNTDDFPSIISVDGEIYQSQLIYRVNQLFPGQKYIPEITDSPLLAYSPMVLMAQNDVAAILILKKIEY
ncbi:hypothetical protein CAL7716_095860 [Calothrix sp. PCC 7716]|nr:hypothetical protein CAL7716_095860 [Calothrix sp. PCC 7716]